MNREETRLHLLQLLAGLNWGGLPVDDYIDAAAALEQYVFGEETGVPPSYGEVGDD